MTNREVADAGAEPGSIADVLAFEDRLAAAWAAYYAKHPEKLKGAGLGAPGLAPAARKARAERYVELRASELPWLESKCVGAKLSASDAQAVFHEGLCKMLEKHPTFLAGDSADLLRYFRKVLKNAAADEIKKLAREMKGRREWRNRAGELLGLADSPGDSCTPPAPHPDGEAINDEQGADGIPRPSFARGELKWAPLCAPSAEAVLERAETERAMQDELKARLGNSPRTLEIAEHLTSCADPELTAKELAKHHGISVNTFNWHRKRIRAALKAPHPSETVAAAPARPDSQLALREKPQRARDLLRAKVNADHAHRAHAWRDTWRRLAGVRGPLGAQAATPPPLGDFLMHSALHLVGGLGQPPSTSCLAAAELAEITGKERPSAQARVLNHLGITHMRRPDGTLLVHRAHYDRLLGALANARQSAPEAAPNWDDPPPRARPVARNGRGTDHNAA